MIVELSCTLLNLGGFIISPEGPSLGFACTLKADDFGVAVLNPTGLLCDDAVKHEGPDLGPNFICKGETFGGAEDSLMTSAVGMYFTLPVGIGFCLLELACHPELGPSVCIDLFLSSFTSASGKIMSPDRHDSQTQSLGTFG